ncbi:MAG: PAS domain-containing protein [Alphaproteobacteria bacterium]|nr:PAS domain-containing protein [Alphaproteobacteria bacterium]
MTAASTEAPHRPPKAGGVARWFRPPLRVLTGLIVLLVVTIIGMTIDRCVDIYVAGRDAAHRNVVELSGVLGRQVAQTVASIDATLLGVVDAVELTDRQGAEGSDAAVRLIQRRLRETPQIRDLVVLDATGRSRFVAGEGAILSAGLAVQDFFAVQGDAMQAAGLQIGAPIINAGQGSALVPLSRRFNATDGRHGGVVVAIVAADVLAAALRPGDRPGTEEAALWSAGGVLLARSSSAPGTIGQSASDDAARRPIVRTAVPGYPFFVSVASDETALRASLTSQIASAIAIALARLAAVAAFAFLLYRQIRRHEADAADLRADVARLRDFAAANADWYWETDSSMRFTYISGASASAATPPLEAFIGKTARDTEPRGVSDEQWERHEAILRARLPFRDFRLQRGRPGKRLRHLSINGVPVFDARGRFAGYRGTGRDVTEETESADTLRAVIDAVPAMISAKDTAQRFVFMNSYQATLYGTTPEAALGLTPAELLGAVAGSHAGALDRRVLETGVPTGFFEERFTGADGVARDWLSAKLPIRTPSGEIRLVLTVSMDITAQKTAEKQLRNAHGEIVRAKETAEQASVAKSEFLANVSHELRTPLNAIIGFSEIMSAAMYGPIGSERYLGYVRDINHSALYLLDLINDILDMAKIEAGKRELALEAVDIAAEIGDTVRMFGQRVGQEGVNLVAELPPWPSVLQADRRAIRQILINIVGNAVKFTPRGRSVYVTLRRSSTTLDIVVRDEGAGIPADQIEKLGTPFFQVNDYTARSKPGSGLGLALTKSLVSLHGGTMSIESQLGQGTTVVIAIPFGPVGARDGASTSAA